jgi:Flp pilus assembly pilin Flp
MRLMRFLCRFWAEDGGQDLVEYSLIIAIFVFLMLSLVGMLSPYIDAMWTAGNSQLASANSSAS